MDNAKKRRMNSLIGKNNVMKSALAQLSVIISVSLLLTACPSNEGAKSVSDPDAFFLEPLPQGLPVFIEINEPYWAHDPSDTENEKSLSLYSVALPINGEIASDPVAIFSTSSDQVISLNTVPDENDQARSDISILVNNGNVYKVDHQKGADNNGSIRLLHHFVNKICEIIPVEIVQTTSVDDDVTHTVLHSDKIIYVVTVDGAVTAEDCASASAFKRFYELPFNFQFNADDVDETNTNDLKAPVSESLARAKLIFGWVDDEVSLEDTTDQRLTYGYIGYSLTEQKLRFYDESRAERWCQPRDLQTFEVDEVSTGVYSPEYLFQLTALEQQQYQLQLGLDVFVFDSTAEIFARPFNVSLCEFEDSTGVKSPSDIEIESILTDRVFKASITLAGESGVSETVKSVTALSDNNEILMIDDSSIFRYNYLDSHTPPATTRNFNVQQQTSISIDKVASQSTAHPFSQFDLKLCTNHTKSSECSAAHDLEANEWQFITGCDADNGCNLAVDTSDFCATAEELIANPNAGILCSVLDYRHLGELNNTSNDVEFRGFMQYEQGFINSLDYILHDDSLFITARMYEKEILLRYFYNIDLSGAKSDRENILFGERKKHFGLDVYLNEGNLFVTALKEAQKRENDCYKNYLSVECDLTNNEPGFGGACTADDIKEGKCFNGFQEYESMALFCSSEKLSDGSCSDDAILAGNLAISPSGDSAKWLKMFDLDSGNSIKSVMYLLAGELQELSQGEGVLINPLLYKVDNSNGEPSIDNVLGQLSGTVEAVRSGWVSNDNLARFDVVTKEVNSVAGDGAIVGSASNIYLVTDPKLDNSTSVNKQVFNVGEVNFLKLNTQLDSNEE